jgi:hypothetical protein
MVDNEALCKEKFAVAQANSANNTWELVRYFPRKKNVDHEKTWIKFRGNTMRLIGNSIIKYSILDIMKIKSNI